MLPPETFKQIDDLQRERERERGDTCVYQILQLFAKGKLNTRQLSPHEVA